MKPNNKTINFYFFFTFLYILPLLLINNYYIDDISRSIAGYGWQHDGRVLSTKILQLLSFGELSVDLFPYTTILASIILALSGYYISKILNLEQNQTIKYSGLLLLTSPFMLENLSYRWDSLPMSISVVSTVIPFLFISCYKKFIPISIVCLLVSLFTFQPAIVIYLLIIICLIISYCLNKTIKDIKYILITSFISLIATVILYKIAIIYLNIYFNNRNLTIFSAANPTELLTQHIVSSFTLIGKAFNYPFKLIFLILIVLSSIIFIKFFFSKKNFSLKIICLISLMMILPVVISLQVLPIITGVTPRVLVTFSFLFYSLLIFINFQSEKLCKYISISILIVSFPLMAVYANSLKNQNIFEDFLIRNILTKTDFANKNIIIDGVEPWAPELKIPLINFPLLSVLIPRYMNNDWVWGTSFLSKKTYSELSTNEYIEVIKNKKVIPIIDKTNDYYIKTDDSILIIDFTKKNN